MRPLKFKDFNLTFALFLLFTVSIIGHYYFGYNTYNSEQLEKGLPVLSSWVEYSNTGHFISSISENMESEFLQMALFVFLTMCLYQRGSSESKKPEDEKTALDIKRDEQERAHCEKKRRQSPVLWRLYENSLTIALMTLFTISFFLHAWGSMKLINKENLEYHKPMISFLETFNEPEFWFESFQNWQSEFFSVGILIIFSIFLRQKDSSQSKKMSASNWETGSA